MNAHGVLHYLIGCLTLHDRVAKHPLGPDYWNWKTQDEGMELRIRYGSRWFKVSISDTTANEVQP